MNLKRANHKTPDQSSQKDIEFIMSMKDVIASREDLQALYEREMNEFTTGIALLAMKAIIDAEIEGLCGKPYSRSPEHECYRHGKQQTSYVIVNGQKHQLAKPRVVKRKGKKEVALSTYQKFQQSRVLETSIMAKMLCGVSTPDYRAAAEAVSDGYGIEKSSVSRNYVRNTSTGMKFFLL